MVIYKSYDDLPKISLPFGQEVFISDSTIRDGSQMPGIVMKRRHKLRIYEFLHDIGIEKLETFVYHKRDWDVIADMQDIGYEYPEVTGWARALPSDIDFVLDVDGIGEVGILMSVSDSHIFDKMQLKSREEAHERYLNALQYAVDHGLRTRVHLEDMTRADLHNFVYPLVTDLIDIDPDCIVRICDTLGFAVPFEDACDPYSIPKMVSRLRELGVANIETHIHDDFGLSVSSALAGFWYGANWSSLTFLGIGERSGNTELEKILLFLTRRVEGFEKYDLSGIVKFAEYMEHHIGIRIPRNKSIVGKNVFVHESGIHTAGVIKNPFTYEPYPPEIIGAERQLLIGDSSGRDVVRHKVEATLRELMHVEIVIDKNDPRIAEIQKDIQKLYDEEQRVSCISDEELTRYVEKYFMLNMIVDGEELHDIEEGE
ncbi:isopropylmalate synthase [ANME-2 cluster archaeon]|nr:MAG: isopropylmalate synthase [ANME-2 cluster archaeon]RLG24130.1 MAG: isopropylmalate synthase [Methanosarcinales archaeon]